MAQKKNIVFVVADSLRYDSILQREDYSLPYAFQNAHIFTQARSSGSWTLPATASMFSGLHVHEHGATSQTRVVSKDVELLAERLRREGYRTVQVTANSATTHIFGLDRGFEKTEKIWEIEPRRHHLFSSLLSIVARPRLRKKFLQNSGDLITGKFSEEIMSATSWMQSNMEAQFALAQKYITEFEKSKEPYFVFINLMESHFPYHIADTFTTSLNNPLKKVQEVIALFHLVNQSRLLNPREKISPKMLDVLRTRQKLAWSLIAERLDAFLKKMHSQENRLVVFASDHGDNFGEQEKWQYHFSNINDAGNRTALFVLPAGENSQKIVNEPVSMRDVHGTILANAGLSTKKEQIDLLKDSQRSLTILQSFWYDKGGKTLPQYIYNQFAFLHKDTKFVSRNGKWLRSQVRLIGQGESPFEKVEAGVHPVEDIPLHAELKKDLVKAFAGYEKFCQTI